MVVSSLVMTTLRALPSRSSVAFSSLRPISSLMTWPPVRVAMSCSMALRRSPKPGALTAADLKVPRTLLTMSVARASPSTSSAMRTSGFPPLPTPVFGERARRLAALHDLLEQRQQVLARRDLAVGDQDVGVVEDGLHPLGVGHEEIGRAHV